MDIEQIFIELDALNYSDLLKIKDRTLSLMINKTNKVEIELSYNDYKGKTWIANVDEHNKKILNFVNPISTIKEGSGYKGTKVFELAEGTYCLCERNCRSYIKVENGEFIDI